MSSTAAAVMVFNFTSSRCWMILLQLTPALGGSLSPLLLLVALQQLGALSLRWAVDSNIARNRVGSDPLTS